MRHEFQLAHNSGAIRGSLIPILAGSVFVLFIIIAIVNSFISIKNTDADIIKADIKKLSEVFNQIEKDCKIIDFENEKSIINFLNVKSFEGSQVGPVNLKHPEKWKGPYLKQNPTIQGKDYMVVRTRLGYYIMPSEGVKLPNGKIIGKDIKIDEKSDIQKMMADNNALSFKGQPLAILLDIKRRGAYFKALETVEF